MKRIIFSILIGLFYLCAAAQTEIDFDNYTPMKCSGQIPEDFKTELAKLVDQEKSKKSSSRIDKKREVEFAELSNHQLNSILYSGRVLYGDAMTNYVNSVADVVLKKEPELRKKVRFYVLKNTDLNAYSTQRGIIFVSLGLLAQIESEAQLAFIICHEVVHFRNNHNLASYKKRKEIVTGRNASISDRLESMMDYSKENELEADKEGLKLFMKSEYGTKEINNLFDVLLYSYLPFDEIPFDSTYFNLQPGYVLPSKYFIDAIGDITAEEDVSDSMSTHPNIKKRRLAVQKLLENKNNDAGPSFILSKEEFLKIQRAARCELAIIHLQEGETEDALYAAYLLEKLYGKNKFSDKIVCSALYMMAKQKTHNEDGFQRSKRSRRGNTDKELEDEYWKNVEGQSQAVYYFSYSIPSKELSILSAAKSFDYYKTYNEKFFLDRFNSSVYDLVNSYDLNKENFRSEFKLNDTATADTVKVSEDSDVKLSKISKLKKIKASQTVKADKSTDNYFRNAIIRYYNDSTLNSSFEYYVDEKSKKEKLEESDNYIRYNEEKEKVIARHGEGHNIKKFVMINPMYSRYITRSTYYNYTFYNYKIKDPSLSPLQEENIERSLVDYLNTYAKKLDIDLNMVGVSNQREINTEMFNDYQQMMSWFSERVSVGTMGAYMYNDQYMEKYINEFGYMGFCYVSNVNKSLEVVFILFDIRSGGSKFLYEKDVKKGKPQGVYSKMMLYDILHQISQKPHRIDKLKKKYGIDE